ncbi:unnamed protein product [Rotaria sp. Silwood2]|nr:unnamed protein product [Rotaria sp. Silwood2]
MDLYGQVWQSSDLSPDRLTSELNKVFTLNESATEAHGNKEKYYNVNQEAAAEYAKSGSASLTVGWKFIGGSASAQYAESGSTSQASSVTQHDVMSESDIKHFINQQSVEIAWEGEKFIPKAFKVVKVTDVADRMQVAVIAKQLTAEQSRGAIIRSVSALNNPTPSSLALFTGEIRLYASVLRDPPINWLRCNGSRVSRVTYSRLFAVIGTTYDVNNNDTTSFQLPDLRGRVVVGRDPSEIRTNNTSRMGATGGQSRHTLTNDQLPAHYHDRGSLTIGASGSHTHGIYDPGHQHNADIRENGGSSQDGYYFNAINGKHNWYSGRVKVQSTTTGILVNTVGNHAHILTGNTGSTGNAHSFSLLNPYQTLDYIIYAG